LSQAPVHDEFDSTLEDQPVPKVGKVLIAEDIKTNRLVLVSLLDTLNIDSWQAADGKEALKIFKSDPSINFILMDVKMPQMDGIEATIAIREWEEIKKLNPTPIVAVTAFDYAEDIKRCMDAGMNDIMYKPVDLKTLSKVVDKHLKTKIIDTQILTQSAAVTLKNVLENRTEEIFSAQWLTTFVSDHKKLASVLLLGSMNDMPNYLKLLREAIETQQWIEAKAIVHVLKGLFRQIGAVRLATIFSELDGQLKNGGTLESAVYEGLLKEYQLLEAQLQLWLSKNS
jgi:CheY-like chemotaxis protein